MKLSRYFFIAIVLIFYFLPSFLFAQEQEIDTINQLESAYLPDKDINLAESALILSKTVYPKIDVDNYLTRINEIANEISSRLKANNSSPPEADLPQAQGSHKKTASDESSAIILEINRYFKEKKVKAESILTTVPSLLSESEREKFLLNKVLDTMSGNCLGLTTLYWSIAERLDLPLSAVIIPQHVFLRYYKSKEEYINIEATAYGGAIEDKEYIKQTKKLIGDKIPLNCTPDKTTSYVLSKKQFIGLILYNRGVDYSKREFFQNTLRDFTLALRIYVDFHEAYKSRAGIYLKEERFQEAVNDLKKATGLEPDCPSTYYNLGVAYFNLKDYNEALKNLDRAIDLVPQYLEAYRNRGLVFAQQQRYKEALNDLSFVIDASPSAKAYYDRGSVYFNMKKYNESIKDYTEAIDMDERYADAYNNRGIVYATQERYSEAVKDFEQAVKLQPERAACYKNLGLAFYKMENSIKAKQILKKYLELNPNDEEIIKLINQLK
ncbi:MAG: tetratricopeptide repeat protein [Planctomycetota bacterium]